MKHRIPSPPLGPIATVSHDFNDPEADVAFVSTDYVRFHVRSGFLLQSGVFEDMLLFGPSEGRRTICEAHLQKTAADLSIMLGFLVRTAATPKLTLQSLKRALRTADK